MSVTIPGAIAGQYFDGRQSRPVPATLTRTADDKLTVHGVADGALLSQADRRECRLSARLGNLPRQVDFPTGARFESRDHVGVERLLVAGGGIVHWLESRYRYVLAAIAILIGVSYWTATSGIPLFAEWVAYQLPGNTYQEVGRHSLDYLDKYLFEPSELSPARQRALQTHFAPYLREYTRNGVVLAVHFRKLGSANALALPSGDIVFSDKIVALAENDDELVAVLAHEIGHVVRRHAVRRSLQAGILGVVVAMLTGDASGLSQILAGAPLLLMKLGYSRDMEREADEFALAMMQRDGIPEHRFTDILSRLADDDECTESNACEGGSWERYLSTHPGMGERLQRFTGTANPAHDQP